MFDVKKMIEEIAAKKEIKNVSFVGCGGSLACFFAPHYYVTHEAKTLTTLYENANEFTNDTPAFINENAIVVCASRRGNTPQTVEAA
jgi:fructoselysine 6-phosphate deglycase